MARRWFNVPCVCAFSWCPLSVPSVCVPLVLLRFEAFSWNEDETRVAYVAEEAAPKPRTFGKSKAEPSAAVVAPASAPRGRYGSAAKAVPVAEKAPAEESASAGSWKGQGDWQSDWGEQYTGKGRPLLFVLSITE